MMAITTSNSMRVKDFFILTNDSNGSESMTFLGKQLEKPGNAMAKKGGHQIRRITIICKDSWENKPFWTKKRVFRGFRGKGNEIWWTAPWHRLETDWRFPSRVIKLGVVVPQFAACRVCLRPHLACFCLCIYGITQAFCTTCPSRQGPPVWRGEFHPCLS